MRRYFFALKPAFLKPAPFFGDARRDNDVLSSNDIKVIAVIDRRWLLTGIQNRVSWI